MEVLRDVVVDTSFLLALLKAGKLSSFVGSYNAFLPDLVLYDFLRIEAYLNRDITELKRYLEEIFIILRLDDSIILRATTLWAETMRDNTEIPEFHILLSSYAIEMDLPLLTLDETFNKLTKYGLKLADTKTVMEKLGIKIEEN